MFAGLFLCLRGLCVPVCRLWAESEDRLCLFVVYAYACALLNDPLSRTQPPVCAARADTSRQRSLVFDGGRTPAHSLSLVTCVTLCVRVCVCTVEWYLFRAYVPRISTRVGRGIHRF